MVKSAKKSKSKAEEEVLAVTPVISKEKKSSKKKSSSSSKKSSSKKSSSKKKESELSNESIFEPMTDDGEEDDVEVKTSSSKKSSGSSKKSSGSEGKKKNEKEEEEGGEAETMEDATQAGKLISSFRVSPESVAALKSQGIERFFPIQESTYDKIFDGADLLGRARTGTGKTLSFSLPVIERIKVNNEASQVRGRPPIVLVVAPTRELALQVHRTFEELNTGLATTCIYGGAPYGSQERALYQGLDVLVGTPGRIIDHMNRGRLDLTKLKYIIMDEADEMLNFGFQEALDTILEAVPVGQPKQTLLFSATVPVWVKQVARKYMRPDYVTVDLVGAKRLKTAETVKHLALCCSWQQRNETLRDVVRLYSNGGATVVFVNTKKEAYEIAQNSSLRANCEELHGDIAQSQRERTLSAFRDGKFSVLVATDVAARGLDVQNVKLVIQCSPPTDYESYIHRSGRTGRAGSTGVCLTFFKPQEEYIMLKIEKRAGLVFKRVGCPQSSELASVLSEEVAAKMLKVAPANLELFQEKAQALIEERDAETVVSQCLALLCGYVEEVKQNSLLASRAGYTTVKMVNPSGIHSPRFVLQMVQQLLDRPAAMGEVRLCEDGVSAVFDLESKQAQRLVEEQAGNDRFKFTLPSKLPALAVREQPAHSGGWGQRGGGYGGGRSWGRGGAGASSRWGSNGRGGGRGGSSYSSNGRGGGRGGSSYSSNGRGGGRGGSSYSSNGRGGGRGGSSYGSSGRGGSSYGGSGRGGSSGRGGGRGGW